MRLEFVSSLGMMFGWFVSILIGWGLLPDANYATASGIFLSAGFVSAALAALAWGRP